MKWDDFIGTVVKDTLTTWQSFKAVRILEQRH